MVYILAVNPAMLSKSNGLEQSLFYEGAIFLGTALSAFIGTFLMAIITNVPISLAPGMGLNAFFSFTVASNLGFGLNYYQALVCVFISGILYLIIAISPARIFIIKLMPENLKTIIAIMIGFFLAYVGLVNIGLVSPPKFGIATEIGHNFSNKNQFWPIVLIGTLALIIGILLYIAKIKYSIIISSFIAITMLLIAFWINQDLTLSSDLKTNAFSFKDYGDFSNFNNMSRKFFNSSNWTSTLLKPASYVAIFTFLYVDFFDTSGSLFALGKSAKLIDSKNSASLQWINKANYVDGAATITGALLLNSSVTSVMESNAAIACGAKTGFSALITSLLILLSLSIWPLMGAFLPIGQFYNGTGNIISFQPVTGQAIFLTGLLMIIQIKYLDLSKGLDLPLLGITILFGTLGYSISIGLSWGIFFYVSFYLIDAIQKYLKTKNKTNSFKELNLLLYVLFVLSIIFIIFDILSKAGLFNI